jgi:hypothetical protein
LFGQIREQLVLERGAGLCLWRELELDDLGAIISRSGGDRRRHEQHSKRDERWESHNLFLKGPRCGPKGGVMNLFFSVVTGTLRVPNAKAATTADA